MNYFKNFIWCLVCNKDEFLLVIICNYTRYVRIQINYKYPYCPLTNLESGSLTPRDNVSFIWYLHLHKVKCKKIEIWCYWIKMLLRTCDPLA